MNIPLLLHTVRHLTPSQICHQVLSRLVRPGYIQYRAPASEAPALNAAPIPKPACYAAGGEFTFLNIRAPFTSWTDMSFGALWAYNLNYFDYMEQMPAAEACRWMDRFIQDFQSNAVGQDPYPTALRTLNWLKFFAAHPECRTPHRIDSLYSQYMLLGRRTEYHIGGNHLLEDAFALTAGAVAFGDGRLWRRGSALLRKCLKEQILPDGAHYEQSPMYHCILTDRLLDVYNLSLSNRRFAAQAALDGILEACASRMLGHLESIVWADGQIPLLNDSAYGVAPAPGDIFGYAARLGLKWGPVELKECGYRHFRSPGMEAFIDAGSVTAVHQPGHTHADTFSYELRMCGRPFIVDTGISTYDKNCRRQYERSTAAHNTVEVDGRDSSEVWAGFRVGRRAEVRLVTDEVNRLEACHDGYGRAVSRSFSLEGDVFKVEDSVAAGGAGVSYIHFAPGVTAALAGSSIVTQYATVTVEGAEAVELCDGKVSQVYNRFGDVRVARIHFTGKSSYTINCMGQDEYTVSDL